MSQGEIWIGSTYSNGDMYRNIETVHGTAVDTLNTQQNKKHI